MQALTHGETTYLCGLFPMIQVYEDITAKFFHCDKLVWANPVLWIGELVQDSLDSFTCLKFLLLKLNAKKKARTE